MSRADQRSAARLAIVQALYQMDVTGKGLNEILAEFESFWIGREVEGDEYKPAEVQFFRDVLAGVLKEQRAIDPMIDRTLAEGWPLKRAGAYELKMRPDVPARVVIAEYVAVASAFFEREEAGMTNAVLDRLARQLRPKELDEKAPRFSA